MERGAQRQDNYMEKFLSAAIYCFLGEGPLADLAKSAGGSEKFSTPRGVRKHNPPIFVPFDCSFHQIPGTLHHRWVFCTKDALNSAFMLHYYRL